MNRSLHAQSSDYIHKFNTTTGEHLGSFGKYGIVRWVGDDDADQLNSPHGIAAHNGKVYVADHNNKRIVMYTYWEDRGYYKCKAIGQDELSSPYSVAVNSEENVLLVAEKCGIVTFTLEGLYEGRLKRNKSFDTRNPKDAGGISPQNIAIDADGLILITSGSTVHVFDPAGNYISCFGHIPSNQGIAISRNGSIYVSDDNERNIQVWS